MSIIINHMYSYKYFLMLKLTFLKQVKETLHTFILHNMKVSAHPLQLHVIQMSS